jgi:hypothetical protein
VSENALAGEWRRRGSAIVLEEVVDFPADAPEEFLGWWFGSKPKRARSDVEPVPPPSGPSAPPAPDPQTRPPGHIFRPIPTALQVATRDFARARRERLQAGRELRAAEATIVERRSALASAQTDPPSLARLGARTPSEYGPLLRMHMGALERAVVAAIEAKRGAESKFVAVTRQLEAAKGRYEKERLEAEKRKEQVGLAR